VRAVLTNRRLVIECGGNRREYYLASIGGVRLVEGFGINTLVARVNGSEVELLHNPPSIYYKVF